MMKFAQIVIFAILNVFIRHVDSVFEPINCDFSSKTFCNLTPGNKGSLVFKSSEPFYATKSSNGPLQGSSDSGYFVKLEGDEGSLLSNEIHFKGDFCLSFYYYIFGNGGSKVQMRRAYSTDITDDSNVIFHRDEKSGDIDKWHHFLATIHDNNDGFGYSFELARKSSMSQVAIDNIEATAGQCDSERYYCDFDFANGKQLDCPWVEETSSDKQWYWFSDWAAHDGVVLQDHSSRSSHGGFLSSKRYNQAQVNSTLSLTIKPLTKGSKFCFSFWIFQYNVLKTSFIRTVMAEGGATSEEVIWSWEALKLSAFERQQFDLSWDTEEEVKYSLVLTKLDTSTGPIALDSLLLVPGSCPSPISCFFDQNFCGYTTTSSAWRIGSGRLQNLSKIADPSMFPVDNSRYAYLDMTGPVENTLSYITSDTYHVTEPTDFCATFTYFFNNPNQGQLSVRLIKEKETLTIFGSEKTAPSKDWVTGQADFKSAEPFHLVIIPGLDHANFFAIDSIQVAPGACRAAKIEVPETLLKDDLSCDFQGGMCKWRQDIEEEPGKVASYWKLSSLEAIKADKSLPRSDHTIQAIGGKYIYLKQEFDASHSLYSLRHDTSSLEAGTYCLSLWSIGNGPESELFIRYNQAETAANSISTTKWSQTLLEFKVEHKQTVTFTIDGPSRQGSLVAVDDIELKKVSCVNFNSDSQLYGCTFSEKDKNCALAIDGQDRDQMWHRTTMQTHATHERHKDSAMTVNVVKAATSRFWTPMLTPGQPACVAFWYKITGTDPALNLKVTVEKGQEVEDDEQDGDVVLVEYGAKADIWHPILHQVNYLGQWRLAFAAARKRYDGSITNNVAIDDLRVTLGLCPPLHSCDFALDNCLWQNIPLLEAKESATIVKEIKANGDFEHHSCEFKMEGYPNADSESDLNGAYLISEWGNSLYLSPKISMPKKIKQACLSFFTCTTHASQTIRVFKTTDLQKNADMIGSFNDRIESKSCKWIERQVQVDLKENDPRGFWLVLHSYQDSSIGGSVIAIDDISLAFEACPALPLIYECQDKKTQISQDKLCDFHKDCPWGDDEVNCGYDIDLSGNHLAHWKRGVTGQSWSYTGSREMYVQLKDREYAIYESPEMKRMRYACAMTMRYTLNPMKGDLSVQVAYNGQERIEVYNSKTQVRTRGQTSAEDSVRVTFGKVESHLQVFIVATADKLGKIDAQISSIKFEDQCQYQDYDASATCKARYFKCKSGQCIGQTAVCNGIKECDDGSDESAEECPDIANRTCTFDDFCDFLNVYPSKQANGFTIYRGFHNILFGPTRDHTINSAKGRFAMISALGSTKTASLFTRNILSDCAHFVIKVLGDSQLTVNGKPITITHGQPGNWMYHYVEGLQSQDTLTIEAIVNGRSSYVAIDDFVWGRDCRPASEKSTTVPVPVTPEPTVKPKDDTDKTTRPTEHVIPGTSHIPADTEVHPAHRILWIMCMLFVTTALISGFIYRRQVSGFVSHQLSRFRKDAPIIQMDELAQSENPFN